MRKSAELAVRPTLSRLTSGNTLMFLVLHLAGQCAGRSRDAQDFPRPIGRADASASLGWRRFAGAVKRSGVPALTPHSLRHTAASVSVSAGANVKAVQRLLGHASAAMTWGTDSDLFSDDLAAVATPFDSTPPHRRRWSGR